MKNDIFMPKVIELFAGAGGLALGFEEAGFRHLLLNEINADCCETLKINRPYWPVKREDIRILKFDTFQENVHVVTAGPPCQAFSVVGKRRVFDDDRGQLFFELTRAIKEIKPLIFVIENVKGLLYHNQGGSLEKVIDLLRFNNDYLLKHTVLKAVNYHVPQKRERLIIVGVSNNIKNEYKFPIPSDKQYTIIDAMKKGGLYDSNVSSSSGLSYSLYKREILNKIPPGENWRFLPPELQKEYLGKKYLKGSNAQIGRRLSWNEPSLTLLTNPLSTWTDRCHPEETRPLTIREYARIQTFPDDWQFMGSISSQYRQIGNAVPVNLAKAIAFSVKEWLNAIDN